MSLPALPPTLKPISPYLKLANEYDKRDGVVSYYCKYMKPPRLCVNDDDDMAIGQRTF